MDRGRQQHRPLLIAAAVGLAAGAGLLRAQEPASPMPSVAVPSAAPETVRKRAAEKAMVERRQHELATSEDAQRRIEQLPASDRAQFPRNLRTWNELSADERENLRRTENERRRAEIEKAYQQSGLHLDKDQREVFALRYRQERSKLERDLQEKLEAERVRRLPGLVDGLKKEFADKNAIPAAAGTPGPPPAARSTPSVSVPAAPPAQAR